jgi:hypothetical protein
MSVDPYWLWVGSAVVGALVVLALIASAVRRNRSARLQERFGVEYDMAVRRAGSRKAAEEELRERAEEAERLNIRPLNAEERRRYRDEWSRVEARFVERPTTAVAEADELIGEVFRLQGYDNEFDRRAAQFAVKNPLLAQHYRAGREISRRGGEATTEDLRQAMLHYRALFDDLVGTRDDVAQAVPVTREISEGPRRSEIAPPRDEERL